MIFFDQLGCGKSDQPDNNSLWRIERFVDEVAAVQQAAAPQLTATPTGPPLVVDA